MYRLATILVALLASACASSKELTASDALPAPDSELVKLAPLLGEWTGTAEFTSEMPPEMKAMMPEGQTGPLRGGNTTTWALGGKFLSMDGWHELGPEMVSRSVQLIAWDENARKYHSWYFSDMGEFGEGWMTLSPDGKTLTMTATGRRGDGSLMNGEGKMTFTDADTIAWTWSERMPSGRVTMKGTSTRE